MSFDTVRISDALIEQRRVAKASRNRCGLVSSSPCQNRLFWWAVRGKAQNGVRNEDAVEIG